MTRKHVQIPDVVTGYELNPEVSFLSVISPEGTTNLIDNPSFELGTTSFAVYNAAVMAQSSTVAVFGTYSLRVTPSGVQTDSGVTYSSVALTAGQYYTVSMYFYGIPSLDYKIEFVTEGKSYVFKGTGKWQRVSYTIRADNTGADTIRITRYGSTNTNYFYLDAMQFENKYYMTTYCDGDQEGCYWIGAPHATASVRRDDAYTGGRLVNLADLGLRVMALQSFSMPPIINNTDPYAILDGSIHYNTKVAQRQIAIVGAITAADIRNLSNKKKQLLKLFAPNKEGIEERSPTRLVYQLYDCDNQVGDEVFIDVLYAGGLEGNLDNLYQERVVIQLIAPYPYWQSSILYSYVLDTNDSLSVSYMAGLIDKEWNNFGNTGTGTVYAMEIGIDGNLYIGGDFTNWDGIANADYIAMYDFATGSWNALSTGADGIVYCIHRCQDGNLYVGGAFTNIGGVSGKGIAVWDYSAFDTPGSIFIASGGTVYGIETILDVINITVVIVGDFTNWNGVADADYIARQSGAGAWLGISTGLGTIGRCITRDRSNNLYVGGDFTTAGGSTANYCVKLVYQGSGTFTFEEMYPGLDDKVYAIDTARDGTIYLGGDFTETDGSTIQLPYAASWNGTAFSPLGEGLNDTVRCIDASTDEILLGGDFFLTGDRYFPCSLAKYSNGTYKPVLFYQTTYPTMYAIKRSPTSRDFYFGFDDNTAAQTDGRTEVENTGLGIAYPTLKITGTATPSSFWGARNETNDATVLTNIRPLFDEEVVTLDFFRREYTSSFSRYITMIAASDISRFFLLPGTNEISLFSNTPNANTATIEFRRTLLSIDEA